VLGVGFVLHFSRGENRQLIRPVFHGAGAEPNIRFRKKAPQILDVVIGVQIDLDAGSPLLHIDSRWKIVENELLHHAGQDLARSIQPLFAFFRDEPKALPFHYQALSQHFAELGPLVEDSAVFGQTPCEGCVQIRQQGDFRAH